MIVFIGKEENVRWRALTEEHARDSFENLLFSVCRFRELTGTYPYNITVSDSTGCFLFLFFLTFSFQAKICIWYILIYETDKIWEKQPESCRVFILSGWPIIMVWNNDYQFCGTWIQVSVIGAHFGQNKNKTKVFPKIYIWRLLKYIRWWFYGISAEIL